MVRQLWTSKEPVTFAGDHIRIEGAQLNNRPDPIPAVFFGGSSGSAGPVAAKYSDVYLTWGEPLAAVARNWTGFVGWPSKPAGFCSTACGST